MGSTSFPLRTSPTIEGVIQSLQWHPTLGLPGFRKTEWELVQETGTGFLSKHEFDSTVGRLVKATGAEHLVVIDLSPPVGTPQGGELCLRIGSTWRAFDVFQSHIIESDEFLVDVGVMDSSATWVLIKTPDAVAFFEMA